jgi:hypothetical protein
VDSQKPSRDEALLVSVAESVGSTLGVLAAKANAVQKALTPGGKPNKRRAAKAATKRAPRKRKLMSRKRARRARGKS